VDETIHLIFFFHFMSQKLFFYNFNLTNDVEIDLSIRISFYLYVSCVQGLYEYSSDELNINFMEQILISLERIERIMKKNL